jgi:RimJ/RimL family protein N-acetyltransferase
MASSAGMTIEADGVRLRRIQAETLFELAGLSRLVRGTSPDRPVAPRVWIGGSADGNVVRVRVDVGADAAHTIEALVARERPLCAPADAPVHLGDYVRLLGAEAPVEEVSRELTYVFPAAPAHEHGMAVIRSDTNEGARLLAQLDADGMPEGLAAMGFRDSGDLWPPWCAVRDGGAVVSVAFTARLSASAAEVGVATEPASRGRGLAAAAVAEWASLPALEDRVRLYSTDAANGSSRRVAERLGLALLGPSISIR